MIRLFFTSIVFLLSLNCISQNHSKENLSILAVKLREYEIKKHKNFQNNLYKSSQDYFISKSESFVDEETGFFRIWGEVLRYYESEENKNIRWKSYIDKYYRDTEYKVHIQKEIDSYVKLINEQRYEQVGNQEGRPLAMHVVHKDIGNVNLSDDDFAFTMNIIQEMVLNEVLPEIVQMLLAPVILLLSLILGSFWIKPLRWLLLAFIILMPIYQNYKLTNNLNNYLTEKFVNFEDEHLRWYEYLETNTENFYSPLIQNIK